MFNASTAYLKDKTKIRKQKITQKKKYQIHCHKRDLVENIERKNYNYFDNIFITIQKCLQNIVKNMRVNKNKVNNLIRIINNILTFILDITCL